MARKEKYIYGIDCDFYGAIYAEILMQNIRFRAGSIRQLMRDKAYEALNEYQRQEVVQGIRQAAKTLFYKEGYTGTLIEKVFLDNL